MLSGELSSSIAILSKTSMVLRVTQVPIATQKTMAYKYPDTAPPGFKYYWYRTKVTNLSCAEYPQETKDRLRYYNIYRRDIDFREGVIAKQFVLVGRVPIDSTGVGSYTDNSSLSLADISYDNNPAPMAKMAAERSGVIFYGRH